MFSVIAGENIYCDLVFNFNVILWICVLVAEDKNNIVELVYEKDNRIRLSILCTPSAKLCRKLLCSGMDATMSFFIPLKLEMAHWWIARRGKWICPFFLSSASVILVYILIKTSSFVQGYGMNFLLWICNETQVKKYKGNNSEILNCLHFFFNH